MAESIASLIGAALLFVSFAAGLRVARPVLSTPELRSTRAGRWKLAAASTIAAVGGLLSGGCYSLVLGENALGPAFRYGWTVLVILGILFVLLFRESEPAVPGVPQIRLHWWLLGALLIPYVLSVWLVSIMSAMSP